MKAPAINPIIEGIVGTIANNQLASSYPQSLTFWLRAIKECINFNSRFVEDDHVLGIAVGVDGTTNGTEIKATASWVYGILATSIDTTENVALVTNHATFNPATTALDYMATLLLPIAAATTPVASGLVWFPYWYADVAVHAFGVARVDYNAAAAASTMNVWTPYRNQ